MATNTTRRAAIGAIAAAAIVPATAIARSMTADPVYVAIDRHVAAYHRMESVFQRFNAAEAKAWAAGREVPEDIQQESNEAVDNAQDHLDAVAAVPTSNPEAHVAKIIYLQARHLQAYGDDDTDAATYLAGMAESCHALTSPPHSYHYRRIEALAAKITAKACARQAKSQGAMS